MKNENFFEEFDFYSALKESLNEAIDYQHGAKGRCRVTVRELPVPEYSASDVTRIRKQLSLSQRGLAAALGVSPRTVEAWETGRNTPSGSARHLIYLFEQDSSLVNQLIAR